MSAHRFRPTDEHRAMVQRLVFCGEHRVDIAIGLGISLVELEQHFMDELLNGGVHRRQALIGILFDVASKAGKGSLTAIRHLLDIHDVVRARDGQTIEMDSPVHVGKKAAALLAARNPDVDTDMGELMSRRMGGIN